MVKNYIFNINDCEKTIQHGLEPYLGPVVLYCNFQPIIHGMVESYLYGGPFTSLPELTAMIREYGIPTDVAEEVILSAKNPLTLMLYEAMGPLNSDSAYDFSISPLGDLTIVEMTSPPPSQEERFIQEVREGVERGDYYPDSIRRLAGL
jgi:hypothetical protein